MRGVLLAAALIGCTTSVQPNGDEGQAARLLIPIDRMGQAVSATGTYDGIDYATVDVLEVTSPDAPAAEAPSAVSIDLGDLRLARVDTIHMGGHSSSVADVPDGVVIATLTCEYAEGGSPTRLSFVLGSNTAEWSYGRREHGESFGGVQHGLAPILYSYTSGLDSAFDYTGYEYSASLSLDSSRTLTCIRLEIADIDTFAGLRSSAATRPTWAGHRVIALTLEGLEGSPSAAGSGCDALVSVASIPNDGNSDEVVAVEACCFTDGQCDDRDATVCKELGGMPLGAETECGFDSCISDDAIAVADGACCDGGVCSVLSEALCDDIEGRYGGDDTACDETDCNGDCAGDDICDKYCTNDDPDCARCGRDGACISGCPGIDPDCSCSDETLPRPMLRGRLFRSGRGQLRRRRAPV